jgi:hypothetical protein
VKQITISVLGALVSVTFIWKLLRSAFQRIDWVGVVSRFSNRASRLRS